MEHKIIGPGPYRATKLWNETIELFRAGMSLRKHRVHFKTYENCFSASEAIEYLNDLLRCNQNFGPEVSRNQTIQLLKKFLKNHVIEDVKGRWGKEDFEDNGCLYRFPPSSPLRPFPKKPLYRFERLKFPGWEDTEPEISQENIPVEPIMNSLWYKRHSIAIGEVPASRLICRRELTDANIEEIWKSMTLSHLQKILGLDSLKDVLDAKLVNPKHVMFNVYNTNKQGVVVLEDKSEELPHWMLSAMKCLANWPNFSDVQHPMYVGFERDVFKTIADYHIHLKEPLLTFQLFDAFVNILGVLQKRQVAIEALQVCCLLLPPENRRKLQLLMRMMARISLNKEMPSLSDTVGNRMLMVQTFSRCILCSKDEVDLDELLASRLVTFMMDNYLEILNVPYCLQNTVEEYVAHLRRIQIKYPDSDMAAGLPTHSFCPQIAADEFEFQKANHDQKPLETLLEEIIVNKKLSVKDKKKKLKQFQKSYPGTYKERFPTPESEAAVFPEKRKLKPPLLFFTLKKPFQPFQRTRSFRM
ncbi:DEP domain-containing protein 1B isoform X3 [Rhinatrema bivittatum]|uniref:DEP domain-containing protein 1B isoform X3 n=1 Tax=Rhinatrema bivittatum TaxID=194408 RepID=UPI00112DB829|nr:DEP domain-containing protein 1B isoform X3 [Rhinatrema bivittatum]